MAAFILGAWLGGSVLMILIQVENLRFPSNLLAAPSDQAASFIKRTGSQQDIATLLHYQAAEQNRHYVYVWEEIQFGLALVLAACLFLGTQRRIFPMAFCGLMLVMVVFQHAGVTPELAFRGRETDFPPGNASADLQIHFWGLEQVYGWVEGVKLVMGALLSGYLFVFHARRVRKEIDAIDFPDHSHVDG